MCGVEQKAEYEMGDVTYKKSLHPPPDAPVTALAFAAAAPDAGAGALKRWAPETGIH
jgi:hypothetical protein